jgi:predicted GNAT superfamily acetyltransferase
MHTGYLRLQTHTQNIAFPLQQWLYERASMLRYTHIACAVQADPLNTIEVTFFSFRKGVKNVVLCHRSKSAKY